MNNSVILQCQKLTKSYQQKELNVEVLKGIDLTLYAGQQIAIIGASGSGKSTLLHLLGGLEQPTSGHVTLAGQDLSTISATKLNKLRNKTLGFVYQFHYLLGEFTILENVSMPALIAGHSVKQASLQTTKLLERVGLGHRINHRIGELSGGERQRAAIARALINYPACVLADEPTGNLDRKSAKQVYQLMLELNQELQISFLLATHDMVLAKKMDRILRIEYGLLVEM